MDVTLLGTGSPVPDPNRAGPATLVRAGGTLLLVDAGRGVLMRLAAAGAFPGMLGAVLLTHLHSDHLTDLNDVITTRWVMSPVPNPITVYGPPGTRQVVDGMLAMLAPDISYRLAHHDDLNDPPAVDVVEVAPGDELTIGEARVVVGPTDHRPVEPTVGYRVEHEGRAVVLGGDGIPCAGLDALCAGADAYVQTVLREDMVRMVPDGPLPGHPRLPLHRRAGRHHGRPGGRLDPGAHPLRAGPAARPGGRVARRWPPPTSTARSCSATTSPPSLSFDEPGTTCPSGGAAALGDSGGTAPGMGTPGPGETTGMVSERELEVGEDLTLLTAALADLPGATLMIFDRDLRYRLVRGGALRGRALSAESLEGRLAAEALGPERWPLYHAAYRAALEGRHSTLEVPAPLLDRVFSIRVAPLHGHSGDVIGGVSMAIDVTEQVGLEEQLRSSEAHFRLLAENASDVVLQIDGVGVVSWISPSVERLLGWPADELIGTNANRVIATC